MHKEFTSEMLFNNIKLLFVKQVNKFHQVVAVLESPKSLLNILAFPSTNLLFELFKRHLVELADHRDQTNVNVDPILLGHFIREKFPQDFGLTIFVILMIVDNFEIVGRELIEPLEVTFH